MIDRIDSELLPQRTALNLHSYRQELLAANIANADTPNYKARDIDFKSAYAQALRGQSGGGVALERTAAGHLAGNAAGPADAFLRYRSEYQSAVDGNTVNMDIERSAFADNAAHLQASMLFVREYFRMQIAALPSQ